jgi:tetratricopeptide (TPR) repeat protein
MSSQNKPVQPIPFDAADQASRELASSTPESTRQAAPTWVLPALGALAVLAAVVVFWLPGRIGQQPAPPPAATGDRAPVAAPVKVKPTPEESSHWSDAQLAKLRKEAQGILAELLDAQLELEEIGVEQWAAERFAEARAAAAEGDAQSRERLFAEAISSYKRGREQMQSLLDSAPRIRDEYLERARKAIDTSQGDTARAALAVAAAIEPGNEKLVRLTHRAAVLEKLLPLLSQAGEAEAGEDLATAENYLRQAVALDPEHPAAQTELARVAAKHTAQRFNSAMSTGYQALDEGSFARARTAFNTAARLVPGSAEAASALQEVQSAEIAHRLASLQRSGQSYEQQERWREAVSAYEQALQIDDSLLFAREGLKRSRARDQLDRQLRSIIDQPDRLADEKVAAAAAKLLQQAALIDSSGQILRQQLSQVEELLQKASTPIVVVLRSDMETEVTLRRVRKLGRFKEQRLALRPGTYTVVGVRDGYRDVRLTFKVSHDSAPPVVFVACTEKI